MVAADAAIPFAPAAAAPPPLAERLDIPAPPTRFTGDAARPAPLGPLAEPPELFGAATPAAPLRQEVPPLPKPGTAAVAPVVPAP